MVGRSAVSGIIGGGAQRGTEVAPDFRIRIDLGAVAHRSNPIGQSAAGQPNLRRRFSSSMIDYYPLSDGFHLSFGARRDGQAKIARAADTMSSLMFSPKSQLGSGRGGFKRYSPAATMGYSRALAHGMVIGLEGGALMERGDPAIRALAKSYRIGSRDDRYSTAARVNPVVQVSFGYRF